MAGHAVPMCRCGHPRTDHAPPGEPGDAFGACTRCLSGEDPCGRFSRDDALPPPPTYTRKWICIHCGAPTPERKIACLACGRDLHVRKAEPAMPVPRDPATAAAIRSVEQAKARMQNRHGVAPRKVAAAPVGPIRAGDGTAQCPYCREQIHPEAILCRHCGSDLEGGARVRRIPDKKVEKSDRAQGVLKILAAAIVFAFCSIIQAEGGSSMFAFDYLPPDSLLMDTLINVTFYPGWVMTVWLIVSGVLDLLD